MDNTPPTPEEDRLDVDAVPAAAFVLDERHPAGVGAWHTHQRAQLVHAAEGVIAISTAGGRWVAPPQRAVWVPPGEPHRVEARRPYRLQTLYVWVENMPPPQAQSSPITEARVVSIDRLMAELLAAAADHGPQVPPDGPEARLLQVALDRLQTLAVAPLYQLPRPISPALQAIAKALTDHPADRRTLEDWATQSALTPRTLARKFLAETGTTLGRWRTQLRLLSAVERLAAGDSVTEVALDVGYEDVSSFIAAFKAATGQTPARYFGSAGK